METPPPFSLRLKDYLLSLPPPDGRPVVLGHPPLPFAMLQILFINTYSGCFRESAPSVIYGLWFNHYHRRIQIAQSLQPN